MRKAVSFAKAHYAKPVQRSVSQQLGSHQHDAKHVVGLVIVKVLVLEAAHDILEHRGVPVSAEHLVNNLLCILNGAHVR